MFFILRELYLALLLFIMLIGFQLSTYFFIQYSKHKKENLLHNKILLFYGVIIGGAMSGYLVQSIAQLFIIDLVIKDIIFRIGLNFLLLSLAMFLMFLILEPFKELINQTLNKISITIIFISVICVFIINSQTIGFRLLLIPGGIGTICIVLFQIKLVKLTTGEIKKRLTVFTIGLFLAYPGVIVTNMLNPIPYNTPIDLITITLLFLGISICFAGVYNFPAFLEFEWKKNIVQLFIFEQENHKILYFFNFKEDTSTSKRLIDHDLFSKGILGIERITTELSDSVEEKIDKIKHGEYFILFAYGDGQLSHITYALIVNKDMESMRFFLKQIKTQFQFIYKEFLYDLKIIEGNEEKLFTSFDHNVKSF